MSPNWLPLSKKVLTFALLGAAGCLLAAIVGELFLLATHSAPIPNGICLVLDSSGSMAGEKLSEMKAAARDFVERRDLSADEIAVVGFDSQVAVGDSRDRGRRQHQHECRHRRRCVAAKFRRGYQEHITLHRWSAGLGRRNASIGHIVPCWGYHDCRRRNRRCGHRLFRAGNRRSEIGVPGGVRRLRCGLQAGGTSDKWSRGICA